MRINPIARRYDPQVSAVSVRMAQRVLQHADRMLFGSMDRAWQGMNRWLDTQAWAPQRGQFAMPVLAGTSATPLPLTNATFAMSMQDAGGGAASGSESAQMQDVLTGLLDAQNVVLTPDQQNAVIADATRMQGILKRMPGQDSSTSAVLTASLNKILRALPKKPAAAQGWQHALYDHYAAWHARAGLECKNRAWFLRYPENISRWNLLKHMDGAPEYGEAVLWKGAERAYFGAPTHQLYFTARRIGKTVQFSTITHMQPLSVIPAGERTTFNQNWDRMEQAIATDADITLMRIEDQRGFNVLTRAHLGELTGHRIPFPTVDLGARVLLLGEYGTADVLFPFCDEQQAKSLAGKLAAALSPHYPSVHVGALTRKMREPRGTFNVAPLRERAETLAEQARLAGKAYATQTYYL